MICIPAGFFAELEEGCNVLACNPRHMAKTHDVLNYKCNLRKAPSREDIECILNYFKEAWPEGIVEFDNGLYVLNEPLAYVEFDDRMLEADWLYIYRDEDAFDAWGKGKGNDVDLISVLLELDALGFVYHTQNDGLVDTVMSRLACQPDPSRTGQDSR